MIFSFDEVVEPIFEIKEHTWSFDGKTKVEGRRFNNRPEKYSHIVTNDEATSLTPKEIEAIDDINEKQSITKVACAIERLLDLLSIIPNSEIDKKEYQSFI